jgi:hypothetical protein
MLLRFISSALSKAQIVKFLGLPTKTKEAKEQIVTRLLQVIEEDASEKAHLLDTFPQELAVGPTELEDLLQCSRVERRRWIKEGKIPVLEYRSFRKAGREMLYPVHDRRVILNISQDEIAQWREAYQIQVHTHRSAAAQTAVERRKANQHVRQLFLASWQATVEEWMLYGSPELAVVLKLAYWTVWASRWAKENHSKFLRSVKNTMLYASERDEWYTRKNEAMRVLMRAPYAQLSFYQPEKADRRFLRLCEKHYALKRAGYYNDIWGFFYENIADVKQCHQCVIKMEKDFYALYYLEIKAEAFPNLHFSFHMPYPIGKSWFPAPEQLSKVEHLEQDGLFRFGRSLFGSEKVTHRERDVLIHFEQALTEARILFPE